MRFSTCMSSAVLALALIASASAWASDINSSDWTESDAGNIAAPPNGWPSVTMRPSEVAPAARALMGSLKRWYNRANATKTSGGSANVQTLTYTVPTTAYVAGDGYTFIAGFTNTGATTLNVDGLGAKAIKVGATALGGGEILAGRAVRVYYDGTNFQIEGGGGIVVGTNVALKTITGGAGRRVWREGFTVAGDGGAAPYIWSASNCSAADDGKQVQPSVTGCWIADFSGMKPTPKIWGAVGNGTANDSAAVQAAITAMAGNTLYLGPYRYGLAIGVSCASPMRIEGEGRSIGAAYSGFVQLTTNINLLTLCSKSFFGNFTVEAGAAGTNTSGAAMTSAADSFDMVLSNVWIDRPCIGVDINGNSHSIDLFHVTTFLGNGCGGIRVGHLTTGDIGVGATVDLRITRTIINAAIGGPAERGEYGLLIEDGGGLYLGPGLDIIFPKWGTIIRPGANQAVHWMFANNMVFGDTTVHQPLLIDTASGASSASVRGLNFQNTWTASSGDSHGIEIANVGGGTVSGIHFSGHRAFNNSSSGAAINAGVTDVTFDDSRICNNAIGGPAVGVSWAAGVTRGAIRNSTIRADCDGLGFAGNPDFEYAVHYVGTNADMMLTGNDLGGSIRAVLGLPIGLSVVQANRGIDDSGVATITAAASLDPSVYPYITVVGATPITTIQGCWRGRRIKIRPGTALQFNTGGNIGYAYTATINIPVEAICDETAPGVLQWILGG